MRYVVGIDWCIDAIRDTADGFINGYLDNIVEDVSDQVNIWNSEYFIRWLNKHLRVCVVDAIIHLIFFDNYALSGDHYTKAYLHLNDMLLHSLSLDRGVDHGILFVDDRYASYTDENSDITEDRIMDFSTVIANVIIQYMSDTRIMDMSYMETIIYEINSLISATTNRVIELEDTLTIHHPGRLVIIERHRGGLRVQTRR